MFDSGLRLAKVVRAYPGGHSVDLVMYDDNSPQTNVQVLSGTASSRSGMSGLVAPSPAPDGEWGSQDSGDEDMIAVVGYMQGHPIVLGFLFPQVNQMTFADKNRMTFRSPSDVYATVDGDGNFEMRHPSGAYVRIASNPEHEDLTGKDFDGKWAINRNTGTPVHIHIEQADKKAMINIDPDGNINIEHIGKMEIHTGKNHVQTIAETHELQVGASSTENIGDSWDVQVGSSTTIISGASATITAPLTFIRSPTITLAGYVHITENLQVDKDIHANHDIVSSADVKAGDGRVSLLHHVHNGVQPGGGQTGEPA